MLSPDDPNHRRIVTDLVREVAASTGFTTLTRIGVENGKPFALSARVMPLVDLDELVLVAGLVSADLAMPISEPVSACAVILPQRHIAYLKHGNAPMTTLTIGPNPDDDPDLREIADVGLTRLIQRYQEARRPTGQPFTAPSRMPNTSPHQRPINGQPFDPPGQTRPGPHR